MGALCSGKSGLQVGLWISVVFCVGFETDIYGSFVEIAKRELGSLTERCKTLEPKSELLFL